MKSLVTALGFALGIATSSAFAADAVVINVPVHFNSIDPAVQTVSIRCFLKGKNPLTGNDESFQAYKTIELPLVNGDYTGPSPITLTFKTEDLSQDEQAKLKSLTQVSCQFFLVIAGSAKIPYGSEPPGPLGHKAGTPFHQNSSLKVTK